VRLEELILVMVAVMEEIQEQALVHLVVAEVLEDILAMAAEAVMEIAVVLFLEMDLVVLEAVVVVALEQVPMFAVLVLVVAV
jgi:hypothetical protein